MRSLDRNRVFDTKELEQLREDTYTVFEQAINVSEQYNQDRDEVMDLFDRVPAEAKISGFPLSLPTDFVYPLYADQQKKCNDIFESILCHIPQFDKEAADANEELINEIKETTRAVEELRELLKTGDVRLSVSAFEAKLKQICGPDFKGTDNDKTFFKDKYGYNEYEYKDNTYCSEWYENNEKDLGNGHIVSDCTVKVDMPINSIFDDGFVEIVVKKHYYKNTNMVVYESGNGYYNPNPLSAYIGEKMSFSETNNKIEYKTIDDLQKLNYSHRFDKWYDYGKVALNVGSDILTDSTFGMSAAASTSAKGVATAFVKAVVPTTTKDALQFTLVQGGQMAGDYLMYESKPQDDLFKTVTGLLPGVGTYYAVVDASSNDPLKGFYKPIK